MIEINNLTKIPVSAKIFSTVAKIVLKGENRLTDSVSLAFVDKAEIKKLNKKFRGENKPTDVLAFSAQGGPASGWQGKNVLGEVVICSKIVAEKKENVVEVFIHGILHLCGYDHEKSTKEAELMAKQQNKYFKKWLEET